MEKSTKTVTITQSEYDEYLVLKQQVPWLMEQLKLSKHREFGASSEKSKIPDQLSIFDEAENTADANVPEPELEEVVYKRRKRKGKRKDDLSQSPAETISYTLQEEERICPECGEPLHVIGNNVRQAPEIIPAQIKVVRHEQDWTRQGAHLSRQTMANWVIRCTEDWLAPLYERMRAELLSREVLHADESTVQVSP